MAVPHPGTCHILEMPHPGKDQNPGNATSRKRPRPLESATYWKTPNPGKNPMLEHAEL